MKESDLDLDYFNIAIKEKKPYITPLYHYRIQYEYVPMYTCFLPIISKNEEVLGAVAIDVGLDSFNYNETNCVSVSLFNDKGIIIYCNTDKDCIGANFTNLSHPCNKKSILSNMASNEVVVTEAYSKKTFDKYFYATRPIHMYDDVYWGVEVSIPSRLVLKDNYRIIIIMVLIISLVIILIIIMVPTIINKKIVSVMNVLNNNIIKIKEGDISWSVSDAYLKLNDEMGDMSRGINNTVVYLNDLVSSFKGKVDKVSENSNDISEFVDKINDYNNEMKLEKESNKNYQFVNQATETSKSLLEESKELQKMIEYFKLRE